MPPTIFLTLAIIFSLLSSPSLSLPFLSTISISHISNTTIICAFTTSKYLTYNLTCTALPAYITESYMTDSITSYAAIAAGDGFLCALGPTLTALSNISTMRWWDLTKVYNSASKRIYRGPQVRALSAGESHVCGLTTSSNGTGHIQCWRWPEVTFPQDVNFTDVAVGGDFVCGLVARSGRIRCFGDSNSTSKVAGLEPVGSYSKLAVGTRHACAISNAHKLVCWGVGAPKVSETWSKSFEIGYMALGEDLTCLLAGNGMVVCFGENSSLPERLVGMQFVSIQARRHTVCGVLMANYTLVCWGNKTALGSSYVFVFQHVLPGPCAPISDCKCGVWAGSGNVCSATAEAGICHPCEVVLFNNISSSSSGNNSGSERGSRKVLYIILGCVGGFIVLMAFLLLFLKMWIYRKSPSMDRQDSGRIHNDPSLARTNNGPTDPIVVPARQPMIERRLSALISKGPSSTVEQFPLRVLQKATDNFSESHRIGSGSFGLVYRARLPDGREVAIKRAVEPSSASAGMVTLARRREDRESAFISELALLSRVNHKNLVRLYGFCVDRLERVLVYEFMENGALYDHLHKTNSASPPISTWHCRLKLALDAARGIEYLHTYAVPPIIHRDIKSANILLDASWAAKVSDFGLSLLRLKDDDKTEEPERTAGTVGYMDPEYYRLQNLTDKSDVYSFGVVLLELLSGCKAIIQSYGESTMPRNIVEIVVPFITSDDMHHMLDKRLPPPAPTEIEAVAFVGCLAADCVAPAGRDRPTMSEVVCALERAVMACAEPVLSRSLTEQSD
ncbi:receptor-like protein kinase HSL1 [Carex littledalei]|uniref:Receptor-like protein kinase HSL1 n=1 Tax=Carex littledalei TaxID=544730 RepID=A0A833VFI1_9POAL|nr:receptor-like protein kinase HSL1 [Carex littledalei]